MTEAGLVRRIASLGVPTRGSFFRSIPLVYIKTPLSAIGSYRSGGRYNAIHSFEVFYAAADRDTVPRETGAIIVDPTTGANISTARPPALNLTVNVTLQQVVDLTDGSVCDARASRACRTSPNARHRPRGPCDRR